MEDKLINEAVQEELGIADEVTKYANDISTFVLNNVETQHREQISSGVFTNTFRFKRKVFGTEIGFYIKNLYFCNSKTYIVYRKKHSKKGNKFSDKDKTIYIETDYINGWHDRRSLEGTIQHELEHIFQDFKQGYHKEKDNSYYLASANYNNKNNTVQLISRIIYYTEEREIYAFANQAYQAMMWDDSLEVEDTPLYKVYTTLKDGLSFLTSNINNDNIANLLAKFDTKPADLIKRCEWAANKYAKYIGRVIVKVEKDKKREEIAEGVEYEPYFEITI